MIPSLLLPQSCAATSGLAGLISASQQFTQVLLVAIALYFFVGLVVTLAQAQLATAAGDSSGYARALQQGILLIVLLATAAALPALSQTLGAWLVCSDGSAASVTGLWKSLASLVVSIVVGGAGILTSVSVVWSGLGLQASHALGVPGGVAFGLRRILLLLGGLILTLSAVTLANTLLSLLW